jgi:hypothetical protein
MLSRTHVLNMTKVSSKISNTNVGFASLHLNYFLGLLPANTLTWGLLYMAREPGVQSRVQAEIDRVVGGRPPRLADRDAMPYTEAVLMEIQRCANVVPHSLHHLSAR